MSFTNPCSGKVAGTTTITATEANALGVNSARAVDGTGGGTYTPTAVIDIGGAAGGIRLTETSGVPANYQLASRATAIVMDGRGYEAPGGGWAYDSIATTQSKYIYVNANPGVIASLPLALVTGQTLQSVTVYYTGGSGHAAFPGGAPTFPFFGVYHYNPTTAVRTQVGSNGTVIGTPSTDVATYEGATPFAMTTSGLAHVVRRDIRRYFVQFTAEAGGAFQANGIIHGVAVSYDSTYVDPHGSG